MLALYRASHYFRYGSKQIVTIGSDFSQLNNIVVLTETRNYSVVF